MRNAQPENEKPTSILFVCHGNICRSPMAEFIMKYLVEEAGLADCFHIESAATSTEEIGNPVYPGTQAVLARLGIDSSAKRARQVTPQDYQDFDLVIGMDNANVKNLRRLFRYDPDHKVSLLLSFAGEDRSIADPWYTDDFEVTYRDVRRGCEALLATLAGERNAG